MVVVLCGLCLGVPSVHAQDSAPQSEMDAQSACPDLTLGPAIAQTPDRSRAPIVIYAKELDAGKETLGEARGDVELFRADQHIKTDRILYDPATEVVTVPGRIDYQDQQVWFRGQQASYSFLEESGWFSGIDYGLTGSVANGSAERAELAGGNTSILHRLDYTTCPSDKPDWQLFARELELRHDEGMGKARGAKLTFKGVPILYAPYFSFPIDDRRKSGFLYPSVGHANDTGFEIGAPWYWNIAPNHDAVIEPRYFTERGFMLTGEYRFITPRTGGILNFDYMRDDTKTGDTRFHYRFAHDARFSPRWNSEFLVDRVSDDQYFQDFSNSLAGASRQYLRSKYGIYGSGRHWQLQTYVDDFQVVDDAVDPLNKPYTRLPRVLFDLDKPLGFQGLGLRLDAELVYFDRNNGVTGTRFDIYPRFEWNIETNWGYVRPSAGYRYTTYDLNWHGLPGDNSLDRGTEILSFDTGLFFERDSKKGNLQTLEPRLFYLYVPYRDQQGFPDFDTAPFTFGFSQLFHYSRFTGADRQSDANQLTFALTTRSINQVSGRELWSLSFGQIVYFL